MWLQRFKEMDKRKVADVVILTRRGNHSSFIDVRCRNFHCFVITNVLFVYKSRIGKYLQLGNVLP